MMGRGDLLQKNLDQDGHTQDYSQERQATIGSTAPFYCSLRALFFSMHTNPKSRFQAQLGDGRAVAGLRAGTQSDRISLGVCEEQRIGQPGTHGSPGTERRSQEGTMEDQEDATLHQSVLGSINYGS